MFYNQNKVIVEAAIEAAEEELATRFSEMSKAQEANPTTMLNFGSFAQIASCPIFNAFRRLGIEVSKEEIIKTIDQNKYDRWQDYIRAAALQKQGQNNG